MAVLGLLVWFFMRTPEAPAASFNTARAVAAADRRILSALRGVGTEMGYIGEDVVGKDVPIGVRSRERLALGNIGQDIIREFNKIPAGVLGPDGWERGTPETLGNPLTQYLARQRLDPTQPSVALRAEQQELKDRARDAEEDLYGRQFDARFRPEKAAECCPCPSRSENVPRGTFRYVPGRGGIPLFEGTRGDLISRQQDLSRAVMRRLRDAGTETSYIGLDPHSSGRSRERLRIGNVGQDIIREINKRPAAVMTKDGWVKGPSQTLGGPLGQALASNRPRLHFQPPHRNLRKWGSQNAARSMVVKTHASNEGGSVRRSRTYAAAQSLHPSRSLSSHQSAANKSDQELWDRAVGLE